MVLMWRHCLTSKILSYLGISRFLDPDGGENNNAKFQLESLIRFISFVGCQNQSQIKILEFFEANFLPPRSSAPPPSTTSETGCNGCQHALHWHCWLWSTCFLHMLVCTEPCGTYLEKVSWSYRHGWLRLKTFWWLKINFFKVCPGRVANLGSFWFFHLLSLSSSALDHSATAPPNFNL